MVGLTKSMAGIPILHFGLILILMVMRTSVATHSNRMIVQTNTGRAPSSISAVLTWTTMAGLI